MQINKTRIIFRGIIMGILLFFGFSYSDANAHWNPAPVGEVMIGPFGSCSSLEGDAIPLVIGWAYDPAIYYTYTDKDERVPIRVCYEGGYCDTYNTSYTSKYSLYWLSVCGSLGGWCAFQVALNSSYLKEGSNFIQVYAIDPDNNSQTLLGQNWVTAIKRSCSGPKMNIAPYTFNRSDVTETWTDCENGEYVIQPYENSPYGPRCFFRAAWPDLWRTGSRIVEVKNLGIMRHFEWRHEYAYTLQITMQNPLVIHYRNNYNAQQECVVPIQDFVGSVNILSDSQSYFGEFCVALGASKTSITQGESVRLVWEINNVSRAYIDNDVGEVSPNSTSSRWVSPAQTTTYTLTGEWNGFKVTSSVKITVTSIYNWRTGDWSACSVPCGDGTQTRSVWCMQNGTSTVVADSNCTGTKPAVSQICNDGACSTTNKWKEVTP